MEGHLSAHWLAQRVRCPVFPAWLLQSSHVVNVPRSPWCCGELCKALCYSTVLGILLPVHTCWMENFAHCERSIPDLNLLVLKNAWTLPA